MISINLNDPLNPFYTTISELPVSKYLHFNIKNYNGLESSEQSLRCYVWLVNVTNYICNIVRHVKPMEWNWRGTKSPLFVNTQTGLDFNARYSRGRLEFFDYTDKAGNFFATANSSDMVCHELGHAILDTIRPDFWNQQSVEIWAMHEAFADIIAILSLTMYDDVLLEIIKQSNGDLRSPNALSKLAEEMGSIIYKLTKGANGFAPDYCRDASLNYYYVPIKQLPVNADEDQLAGNPHSFSKIFLSAWYEILISIYEKELVERSPLDALKKARDVCASYLIKAIIRTPKVTNLFESVAKIMTMIDKENNKTYSTILNKIFSKWKLQKPIIKMLSHQEKMYSKYPDAKYEFSENRKAKTKCVSITRNQNLKLSEITIGALSLGKDPIISVPSDVYLIYDSKGKLLEEIYQDQETIIEEASYCFNNFTFPEIDKSWGIKYNKLIRNYIH